MDPHSHSMQLIFAILGNIIGVGVNLAPMATFWSIYKEKSIMGFSPLPYVFSLVAALIWVLYGSPPVANALPIITVNTASSAIQIFYITVYLIYAPKKPRRRLLKYLAACVAALTILVGATIFGINKGNQDQKHKVRSLEVGCICVVIGIATYASPLSVAGMVVRTKSAEFLPIVLCVFLFINSTVWTFYGVIIKDIYVLIPNLFGVVFGVAQLALYTIYKNGDVSVANVDDKCTDQPDGKSAQGDGNLQSPSLPSQGAKNGKLQRPSIPSKESTDLHKIVIDDKVPI